MNTQFLALSEGKIAYDDTGSGPLVVCVPGMGDVRNQFRFLAPLLVEEGFRVVTVDNRGHGDSSVGWKDHSMTAIASDVLALIRHLDSGPAVVLGHSIAAAGAILAAAENPDLVRALVLVGPGGVRGELGGFMNRLIKVLFARPWGPAAWRWYYGTLYPTRKPADWEPYTDHLQRSLAQPGRLEALAALMDSLNRRPPLPLDAVRVPALVVMGSKDADAKPVPAEEARWLAKQLGGSATIIEGAGHYPHVEMPELTNPQINAFLKTLQPEVTYAAAAR